MTKSATDRPDIYIGFVCAAGTDLRETKAQFSAQLSVVGYDEIAVKVSDAISEILEIPAEANEAKRIKALMDGGDKLRRHSDDGEGVAFAIVSLIKRLRSEAKARKPKAYLIDSLKNPAEIDLLRKVYKDNFYVVSVYLSKHERIQYLTNKIAQTLKQPPGEEHEKEAKQLISDDEKGIGSTDQDVLNTFPRADFFIDVKVHLSNQIKRFVSLIFGNPFITPTADEYGMSVAKLAALRSCDLSRQVGAVIMRSGDYVVSTGCNEVPLPNGGFYYENRTGGIEDNRDYLGGNDPNYIEIQKTLIEVLHVLQESGHVAKEKEASEVAEELLHGGYRQLMKNARIRNLIEFGRVVHAEMHALSQAASVGQSVAGATLYCTTFPCHGCARHIISSGIGEVVFIEPYPKSLTESLYDNEIEMAHRPGVRAKSNKVRFRPFHGVAPSLYPKVFEYRKRKDDHGIIATWEPKLNPPIGSTLGTSLEDVELGVATALAQTLEKISVIDAQTSEGSRDDAIDA